MKRSLLILLLLVGCGEAPSTPNAAYTQEFIKGRGVEGRKVGVFAMTVPATWARRDSLPDDPVEDTTKSLCEFLITDPEGTIKVSIHNFPAETLAQRIPPEAQVDRWKTQLSNYDEAQSHTTPLAFGGYSGLLFVGVGDTMVIAAALELAPQHFRNLTGGQTPRQQALLQQMRADVTIKAVGPLTAMRKNYEEIVQSINTFGLIDEIPHPR